MKPDGLLLILAATLLWAQWSLANSPNAESTSATQQTDAPRNIARGCSYTFSTPPDYEHCTTGDETTKLTDGVYTQGYFWTQPTTVGWSGREFPIITVDLGTIQSISGVSFSSAAGAGLARWPVAIDLLVSEDGERFSYAGELLDMDSQRRKQPIPDDRQYHVHRFRADTLRVKGRYVAFVISPFNFVFVDEIEIYAASTDEPATTTDPAWPSPEAFRAQTAVQRGIARRLWRDYWTVQQMAPTDGGLDPSAFSLPDAKGIVSMPVRADFRAIVPLDERHRELYRAAAAKLRAAGHEAPFASAMRPMEPIAHIGPPSHRPLERVDVVMMRNEYRPGAIAVTNPLDHDIQLTLRFEDLPQGPMPKYVSVAEVPFTDSKYGEVAASALVDAPAAADGWRITVPSGVTRQIWLTFYSAGLEPGEYCGEAILRDSAYELAIPVRLQVAPVRFPDRPTLGLGGWDYTDSYILGVTRSNHGALVACLQRYGVDSPWATKAVLPPGKYDPATGAMTEPPDTSRFDHWVRTWRNARRFCVFVNGQDSFAGFGIEQPQFSVAVQGWTRFWVSRAKQLGIEPFRFYLLLFDEPRTPEGDRRSILWARAVQAAGTDVTIWTDPIHKDISQADPELFSLATVICANRDILTYNKPYQEFFRRPPVARRLELFSANGPARSMDPYGFYRLQAWECWARGVAVEHFWSFSDNGGASSWNEFVARGKSYTPLFLDPKSVTGSKEMEAIREGIEDYEYLVMLKGLIDQRLANSAQDVSAQAAAKLLEQSVSRVLEGADLGTMYRRSSQDRTVADTQRLQILDAILRLQ